jgi:hypothetical protein
LLEREIQPERALILLKEGREPHDNVDSRIVRYVQNARNDNRRLFELVLAAKEDFLSLVWPYFDDGHILTPLNQPRTLRHVAERLRNSGASFSDLACGHTRAGFPWSSKDFFQRWWDGCRTLDANWTFERMSTLALVQTTSGERLGAPSSRFYIYDGLHRTMVLASRLLGDSQHDFRPVNCLLLEPRPD